MSDDNEDGLTVVLSPVQLAAVMQGGTISQADTLNGQFVSRMFGALQMVGGAIELVGAAGLLLAPEPTALTKVGGIALGANGADNAAAGAFELWTGRPHSTLTERAARAAARSLGCDPDAAETAGLVVDIAVPMITAAGIGAARTLAIRAGTIDLLAEEAAGGHTIARHVGKDEKFLRNRLATEPRITGAGTFRTLVDAEKFVSQAIRANETQIRLWASSVNPKPLRLIHDAHVTVGVMIPRSTGLLQNVSKIRLILRKTNIEQKVYFVLTAHPYS